MDTISLSRARGDTDNIGFTVTQNDGSAYDITDCTFLFTINEEQNPADDTNQKAQLVGTIDDAAAGELHFEPSASDMDLVGEFWCDVQMTTAAGKIKTLGKGKLTMIQDITKV